MTRQPFEPYTSHIISLKFSFYIDLGEKLTFIETLCIQVNVWELAMFNKDTVVTQRFRDSSWHEDCRLFEEIGFIRTFSLRVQFIVLWYFDDAKNKLNYNLIRIIQSITSPSSIAMIHYR